MEGKFLWAALFFFLVGWRNADARGIAIFDNVVKDMPGSFHIRQEIMKLANGVLFKEEVQEVHLGEGTEGMYSTDSEVNQVKGFSDFLNTLSLSKIQSKESFFKHGNEFFCNACVEVSRQAEEILTDSDMLESAKSVLKSLCFELPSNLSAQCDAMLDTYFAEVISMLQDYLSEDKLCIRTKLCNVKNVISKKYKESMLGDVPSIVHDGSACSKCEEFFSNAASYITENTTQEDFITALHKGCSKFSYLSSVCDSLVDNFGPLAFTEISNMQPEEFCSLISLCHGSLHLSLDQEKNNCDFCQSAVLEIKTELKDPETKIKLLEALEKACKQLQNYENECKELVFEYGPIVLTKVEKYLESNDICSRIHLCRKSTLLSAFRKNADGRPVIELPSSESLAYRASQ
eukprot:TRINITY_DN5155_c0_g1_i1.p1 TRINITY_DN5155_c0_g1~~TRINITY_DN5155_c0_g1_i1.p1  ORF type:complete len:403 (+),score=92.58 TRINITY_DN5155_c0_g1_i1:119-1327(+)